MLFFDNPRENGSRQFLSVSHTKPKMKGVSSHMKKSWKKALTLLLASSLTALALVGCGSSDTKDKASTDTPKADSTSSATLDAIKSRGKLIAGVKFDTNLFGLKDPASGTVNGFDIDLIKALAKDILGDETKIEFKEVTSKTRIPMLDKGDIDLIIATMTINEERKKQVNFSDVYFKAGSIPAGEARLRH